MNIGISPSPNALSDWTIAFDLDGTLVETAPDLIGALNIVLVEQGLPPAPVAAARVLVGRGARKLIEHGFAAAGRELSPADVPGLVERFIEAYKVRIADESHVFPGLIPALEDLAALGARLCVCTNKRTDLSMALLDALDLTPRFVAVVGADLAPKAKPDPSHFLAAIAAAGGDPARAMMVGDSANDVDAAKAAGAPVIAVSFGYTAVSASDLGADAVIDSFTDLVHVAQSLAALRLRGAAASAISRAS
jgi:phosphoglycolate phosphatase